VIAFRLVRIRRYCSSAPGLWMTSDRRRCWRLKAPRTASFPVRHIWLPQRTKGKRRKRPRWGLAQLMRPAKAASDVSFVCLPLCYPPNVSCNGLRGSLTRWCHANLRVNQDASKSLHRHARMSSSRTMHFSKENRGKSAAGGGSDTPAAPHGGGRRRTFAASMFCLAQTCGPLTMLRLLVASPTWDVETRLTGWPRKTRTRESACEPCI